MHSEQYRLLRSEGALSLWKGASPALVRAFVSGGIRLGTQGPVKTVLSGGRQPVRGTTTGWETVAYDIAAGCATGCLSSGLTHPLDMLKVQRQAQLRAGEHGNAQVGQESMCHFFAARARKGGLASLWHGVRPAMVRAAILTSCQCTVYTQCKQQLSDRYGLPPTSLLNHLLASLTSGVVTTTAINPLDVVKTQLCVSVW